MKFAYCKLIYIFYCFRSSDGVKHGKGDLVLFYAKIVCLPQSLGVTVIIKYIKIGKPLKMKKKKKEHYILQEFSHLLRQQLSVDSYFTLFEFFYYGGIFKKGNL